jgi:uncharacterized protein
MRRPPIDVRPSPAPRRPQRNRIGLAAIIAILFFLLTSLRGIAGFFTDYLWFDEVGLTSVWTGVLGAKVALSVLFVATFFVLLWVNLVIADRLAPTFRPTGPEDEIVARYQEVMGPYTAKVRIGVAALFALIAGTGMSGQWRNWILFQNSVSFGEADPQFGRDISFFVFRLPFLSDVVSWLFVAILLSLVMTAVAHYLNGGIRLQAPISRTTPQVKAHISVLLGLLALVKAADYYLSRFELVFSDRGPIDGATYTDVNASLPAIELLILISIAAAILFLVNIRLRGWVLPAIAVATWGIVSIAAAALYPAYVQKFQVEPNELSKESPYIERNIAATREALKLTKVSERNFEANTELDSAGLSRNEETIRNIRLWDPPFLERTYRRLQEVRSYFRFNDVDIDRYDVDGRTTQVVLSARELNPGGLPSERQSWVNRHLQFTHGYGAVLSPANAVTSDGQPDFLVKDVPPSGEPEISRPEIYFGEDLDSYAIVNTEQAEIDYTTSEGTDRTSNYAGEGGVLIDSFVKKLALAARFGEVNLMTSSAITSESRALYFRDIRERAGMAAPFLRFDADPYPVVFEGRIIWMLDGYSYTNRYPYAQRTNTDRLPAESGLRGLPFNYVRNSVKVAIDAYEGSMRFFIVDDEDPLIASYQQAFPDLFETEAAPDALRAHFRYPEDLFRVQTNAYGRYHMDAPADFYRSTDQWDIAQDPGSGPPTGQSETTATTDPTTGRITSTRERRMDPYYLLMRLPDEEREDFLLLQPFVPTSRDDSRKELTAFMVAKSDPENYGELEVFVMPRSRLPDGPAIVDARINQEPSISSEITLLSRAGSEVLLGNLLVIPVEDSLLYVRPLYVQAQRTQVPEFKKAIVVFGDQVVMRDTLKEALATIFGEAPETLEEGLTPDEPGGEGGGGEGPRVAADVASLLEQAATAFSEADVALRAGDLATFERRYKEGVALVSRARQASSPTTTAPDGAPPGETTTSTTEAPSSA